MPDNCKMADRRRKKRIGVSEKFRTYVHPYEHRPPDGCVSVCRGGHWPSAVKTKKIQHADANSQTQPGTNLHRRVPYLGDRSADERCSPLRRNTHPVAPRKGRTRRVTKYDHIDPSRSAIPGGFGFWICQRFCRLPKMRACIAGGHVLAHDSQGTSCASHMRWHAHAAIYARFSMVCTISDRSDNRKCLQ